jgi:Rrf2 family iron-sulfur cluster assembly transcriptional regulator
MSDAFNHQRPLCGHSNVGFAIHARLEPVSLADISERQSISISYLEQLFAKLRKSGLVSSVRGPGGGYQLARHGAEIFIAQIIDAVDELVDATRCAGQGDCQQGMMCLTHDLWTDLSARIHDFLSNISLEELVNRREVQAVALRQSKNSRQSEALSSLFAF